MSAFEKPCVMLQDSPIHRHLFWVAVSVLQLDEVSLYAAGLALIEQNLHMLDSMNLFENQARETVNCWLKVVYSFMCGSVV